MNMTETTEQYTGYVDGERVAYAYKALQEADQPYVVVAYLPNQNLTFEIRTDVNYPLSAPSRAQSWVEALTELIDKSRQWDAADQEPIPYTLTEPRHVHNAEGFLAFPIGTEFQSSYGAGHVYTRTLNGFSYRNGSGHNNAEIWPDGRSVTAIAESAWPMTVLSEPDQSDYILADIHIGPLNDNCKGRDLIWEYNGIGGWVFQYRWRESGWWARHKTPTEPWTNWSGIGAEGPNVTDTCVFYRVT